MCDEKDFVVSGINAYEPLYVASKFYEPMVKRLIYGVPAISRFSLDWFT